MFPVLFQAQFASIINPLLKLLPGCLLTTCSQRAPAFRVWLPHTLVRFSWTLHCHFVAKSTGSKPPYMP